MIAQRAPLSLHGWDAITSVGLSAPSACAAMRSRLNNFRSTTYRSRQGETIVGAAVPEVMASGLGIPYISALAAPSIAECLALLPEALRSRTRIYFGAEALLQVSNPAEFGEKIAAALSQRAVLRDYVASGSLPKVEVVLQGEMAFVHGMLQACEALCRGEINFAIVGGAETYLCARRLRKLEEEGRLKTGRNADGLIPGEGSSFALLSLEGDAAASALPALARITGATLDLEQTPEQGLPNRGEALLNCMVHALETSGSRSTDLGFRPMNLTGERRAAIEEGMAVMRCFLEQMPLPPAWYSSAAVGSMGAGVGSLLAGWATTAFEKGYAPKDTALCEMFSDDGQRAAFVVTPASRD
jgi:3-oxoacyl-[acyl-carrier-protein] synthase-1